MLINNHTGNTCTQDHQVFDIYIYIYFTTHAKKRKEKKMGTA